jgi:hypothetical protein
MPPVVAVGLTVVCALALAVALIDEFRREDGEP